MPRAAEDAAYPCRSCSFSLWLLIARLDVSHLGLYDDARFPGRCLLVFDRHVEDFSTIPPEDAARFVGDLQHAARAIAAVVKPARLNYALLGNKEPHVHFHLIPHPASSSGYRRKIPSSLNAGRRSEARYAARRGRVRTRSRCARRPGVSALARAKARGKA